jgi:hypothetical protein
MWRRGARVSWLSLKTKVDDLLVVWPQNHWDDFSSVWASKPMAVVCEWFDLKTTRTVFTGLTSKLMVTGFFFEPQNQGKWFSRVWPQNQWRRFSLV